MAAILAVFWLVCGVAASFYAKTQGIDNDLFGRALPAFLLEATLFLAMGLEGWRARLEKLPKRERALGLVVAALAPYFLAVIWLGGFQTTSTLALFSLAATLALWYVVLPANALTDLGFVGVMVVAILTNSIRHQYPAPVPKLHLDELGHVMWFRTGILAILTVRGGTGFSFGFWPTPAEWKTGLKSFVGFLPLAALLAWIVGFGVFRIPAGGLGKTAGQFALTFLAFLWVVGLAEEFFFRGLLQTWMTTWLKRGNLALIATSTVFGACHLFYKMFPNWRLAVMATVAGVFYGWAFREARSVRASAVTHALTVAVWKVFVAAS